MKLNGFVKVVALVLASGLFSAAMAAGTAAGTDVSNTATLSFGDDSDSLQEVTSNTETFKVDKKIDMTVTTVDINPVSTKPGATRVVLTYRVTNTGNSAQDFSLSILNSSTSAFNGDANDTFDATNVGIFVDTNDNGTYDPDTDTQTYIDELGIDQSATVFVVADIPNDNLSDGDAAVYDLVAQVAEGGASGTQGADITQDDRNNPDNKLTVQIVFADNAGTADGQYDGKFSSVDAFKIVIADMTIVKTSVVVNDPINDTTNPKRIPGATIRYCFSVENGGSANAAIAKIADTIDTGIYNLDGFANSSIRIYEGNDFDCSNVDGLTTTGNPDNTGSVNTNTGQIVIDLDGVTAGSKKSAFFEVTLR